ncbi:hypothetical protein [Streptomyces lydicus]|nr:hypothetical protein [Streptomyces lydicus]
MSTHAARVPRPAAAVAVLSLTYAVQMIIGMLAAAAGAHFLAERGAARCA